MNLSFTSKIVFTVIFLYNLELYILSYYLMALKSGHWHATFSLSLYVRNGVKQGSIISPMLFILYMDALSLILSCTEREWGMESGEWGVGSGE